MGKKYTEAYEVAYYDCDINSTMTLSSMLAIVIKTSEKQSEQLGRTSSYIASFGLTWIITNYEIHINRLPKAGENIDITTEAIAYNKYFCYRNFWIYDAEGNQCVLIKATFVLMDKINRKMNHVLPEIIEPYASEKITKIYRGEKIEKVTPGTFLPYRVRFFDIDGNQHVNNAIYFNWLLDVLGYDYLTQHEPTFINIKFDKEVEYGQEVESHYEIKEAVDGKVTLHEIQIDGQTYCEANMKWRKRK